MPRFVHYLGCTLLTAQRFAGRRTIALCHRLPQKKGQSPAENPNQQYPHTHTLWRQRRRRRHGPRRPTGWRQRLVCIRRRRPATNERNMTHQRQKSADAHTRKNQQYNYAHASRAPLCELNNIIALCSPSLCVCCSLFRQAGSTRT